jgi:hypothetical protein
MDQSGSQSVLAIDDDHDPGRTLKEGLAAL